MKTKLVYFVAPIIALAIFCAFYIPFTHRFEAEQAAKQRAIEAKREAEARAQAEARRQAIIQANKEAERQKQEIAARKAREKAEQDAFNVADAERTKAFNDQNKFKDQVDGLQKQVDSEQKAIADLDHQKTEAVKELDFLKTYIKQAGVNVDNITSLLEKLAAADKARADADAALKKAANNS